MRRKLCVYAPVHMGLFNLAVRREPHLVKEVKGVMAPRSQNPLFSAQVQTSLNGRYTKCNAEEERLHYLIALFTGHILSHLCHRVSVRRTATHFISSESPCSGTESI